MNMLCRSFYERDTLIVARELLGKYIVKKTYHKNLIGMIVETEAYIGPFDKASHSYNYRRTERNDAMYGPPGHAYVYMIYGKNFCLNIVTEEVEKPCAVLIRALEPVSGLDEMAVNRYNKNFNELSKGEIINLTNGPSKLCSAFKIDKSYNKKDICSESFYIAEGITDFEIKESKRININYAEEAKDFLWRFYIKGNKFVSKPHE
ncbi:DNA-3-methyladenine glycosylase [Caloramator quimbayensis]|uniref:Putative 3-methyladenine DNA glycosylase n=1 Tax=Caloramator quimbayensis TaxID=1147123 RepID=A0A1T4Y4I7_9CLOT|nr:DNA-3-methyladenine glycosylase [Caloramator quimbayensis]SKA96231.1 DNA-3-methyladenine glycosylase [Caloramator quimbayensis]